MELACVFRVMVMGEERGRSGYAKRKESNHRSNSFPCVASLGLEPRQAEPESVVLPLHHEAIFAVAVSFSERRCKGT